MFDGQLPEIANRLDQTNIPVRDEMSAKWLPLALRQGSGVRGHAGGGNVGCDFGLSAAFAERQGNFPDPVTGVTGSELFRELGL